MKLRRDLNIQIPDVQRMVREALDDSLGGYRFMTFSTNERTEREFSVGSNPRLSLHHVTGEVTIRGAGDGSIRVRLDGIDAESDFPVRFEQDGDHLHIHTIHSADADSIEFDIEVPRGCIIALDSDGDEDVVVSGTAGPVTARGAGGDLHVSGASGDCTVSSAEGDVILTDIEGSLTVTNANGDTHCTNITGDLAMNAVNGDVVIERSQLSSCSAKSVNGDLAVETSIIDGGDYSLESTNGDARLSIPADSRAEITLRSQSGDVHCALSAEVLSQGKHTWHAHLNTGMAASHDTPGVAAGGTIEVHSISGDVTVDESRTSFRASATTPSRTDARGDAPSETPVEPASPASPATEDATIAILARLEQGELTVEDALKQIDDLS
ncbi:MAG: DUF4097 family beta strand repeat-containing protein [Chloroflexota bacterium]